MSVLGLFVVCVMGGVPMVGAVTVVFVSDGVSLGVAVMRRVTMVVMGGVVVMTMVVVRGGVAVVIMRRMSVMGVMRRVGVV